jgi:putative MFS transporter
VFYCYAGLAIGDFSSGFLSQMLRSRRQSVFTFHVLVCMGVALYFILRGLSAQQFYWLCFFLGFGSGYWAVFATVAAEQFGTNIRSTVATSAPNLVRGSLVLVSTAFLWLTPSLGIARSGLLVGVVVMVLAILGVWMIRESYGTSLDFEET